MSRMTAVLVIMVFFAGLIFAQEAGKVETAAPSEEASAAAAKPAAPAPAVIDGMTADDLLKKWSEKCKAAQTYYEEFQVNVVVEAGGQVQREEARVTAAFERPSRLKVDLAGPITATLDFENGRLVFLDRLSNKYASQTGVTVEQLASDLRDFGLNATPLSPDPYTEMTKGAVKTGDIKKAVFAGKETYEVDLEKTSEFEVADYGQINVSNYFEKGTLNLIGIVTSSRVPVPHGMQVPPEAADSKFTSTKTSNKLLLDELPKAEDGSAIDVFTFKLPESATQVKEESAGAQGAEEMGSTDSMQ